MQAERRLAGHASRFGSCGRASALGMRISMSVALVWQERYLHPKPPVAHLDAFFEVDWRSARTVAGTFACSGSSSSFIAESRATMSSSKRVLRSRPRCYQATSWQHHSFRESAAAREDERSFALPVQKSRSALFACSLAGCIFEDALKKNNERVVQGSFRLTWLEKSKRYQPSRSTGVRVRCRGPYEG